MTKTDPNEFTLPDTDFCKYRGDPSLHLTSSGNIISATYTYHFPNGYGAYVVKDQFPGCSYVPSWELSIIRLGCNGKWQYCYDTDITDGCIPGLTGPMVVELLSKIICLPVN